MGVFFLALLSQFLAIYHHGHISLSHQPPVSFSCSSLFFRESHPPPQVTIQSDLILSSFCSSWQVLRTSPYSEIIHERTKMSLPSRKIISLSFCRCFLILSPVCYSSCIPLQVQWKTITRNTKQLSTSTEGRLAFPLWLSTLKFSTLCL